MKAKNKLRRRFLYIVCLFLFNNSLITGASALPDIAVINLSYSPDNPFECDDLTINITVKNFGDKRVSQSRVYIYLDGVNTGQWEKIKLDANESSDYFITISRDYTCNKTGVHKLTAKVDINKDINESNNEMTINLTFPVFQNQSNASMFVIPSKTSVSVNQTFNINLVISGMEIIGGSFNLTFNSTIIEAVNITEGSFISQCTKTTFDYHLRVINNTVGFIKFQDLCFNEGVNNVSGTGAVAVITFRAKLQGSTHLVLNNANIFNASGDPILGIPVRDGNVKVSIIKPVANFTYMPEHPYTYENILFNAAISTCDGNVTSYLWNFGDENNAAGIVVTHSYTDNETYNVTLTITDNNNAANNITKSITVLNRAPVANAGADIFAYTLQNITFNGSNSYDIDGTIVSYLWNFPNGTSSSEIAYHIYNSCGIYNVTLTAADNDGAADNDSTTVTVYLAGDINHNNVVNDFDLAKFIAAWNKYVHKSKYNPLADFDGDGRINLIDFFRLVDNWMESC